MMQFKDLEKKWQNRWEREGVFRSEEGSTKPKKYILEMFPYPSGQIHMGHLRAYSIGDVLAHYYRMKGFNVLHPMGFDAFGLPAENAAIKNNMHPAAWTFGNIDEARAQFKKMGLSYDWAREVITCREEYYRWTQWLFLKFHEKGLVYRAKDVLNWCGTCHTVLANEQVENGHCWRCENPVGRKEVEGWYFRIAEYADQLVEDLKPLEGEWPDRIILMQRNWMGKSEGVEMDFPMKDRREPLRIFTTRIDTIFGATFMVVAPEHPLSREASLKNPQVAAFLDAQSTVDRTVRTAVDQEKAGVRTGMYAVNPATGQSIPVWVANYVLMGYGTGAIMAVPAHDQRDYEFAKKFGLPIQAVIRPASGPPPAEAAFEEEGVMMNSGSFDGQPTKESKGRMAEWATRQGWGHLKVRFKLRDWSISRQRFWGEPIPIVICPVDGEVPIPLNLLPVKLPDEVNYQGASSPLPDMRAFVETTCPTCGGPAKRETQTLDAFVASSWYFARFADPQNGREPFAKSRADYWLPVDVYVGGPEHACKHLIYARFFQKVMKDLGLTRHGEPFQHLITQGIVAKDGAKMSKSKGNAVSPDAIIDRYGADTGRLFILFAAPPEMDMEWNDDAVEGSFRFANRIWRWVGRAADIAKGPPSFSEEFRPLIGLIHATIGKVSHDIEQEHQFNTAISALMVCLNGLQEWEDRLRSSAEGRAVLRWGTEAFIKLLVPFAPHLAAESWERMGHSTHVVVEAWPAFDPKWTEESTVEIPIQVNGKLRSKMTVPANMGDDAVRAAALQDEKIKSVLTGPPKKVIVIPKKMVNIVI